MSLFDNDFRKNSTDADIIYDDEKQWWITNSASFIHKFRHGIFYMKSACSTQVEHPSIKSQ